MQVDTNHLNTKTDLNYIWYFTHLLTVIGLTAGGSGTVHIYTLYTEEHNETENTE